MLTEALKFELTSRFEKRVLFNENLAQYMAYKIGGPADALVIAQSTDDLFFIQDFSHKFKLPITILGLGTNLLVSDLGIRGISILLGDAFKKIEIIQNTENDALVKVGAGIEKAELLKWAIREGWKGLEFSAGIPGTLGGGIFMNAGTKYGCYGDIVRSVSLFDMKQGIRKILRENSDFSYRTQNIVHGSEIVFEVEILLVKGCVETLESTVQNIIAERAAKQPLHLPSCGSTFKNPEGLSAGRLIEKAGLKGLRIGNAQVSEKHANFILNLGGANSQDVHEVIDEIKRRVLAKFGVELECEVIFLGG